jgi:hypothetical protein
MPAAKTTTKRSRRDVLQSPTFGLLRENIESATACLKELAAAQRYVDYVLTTGILECRASGTDAVIEAIAEELYHVDANDQELRQDFFERYLPEDTRDDAYTLTVGFRNDHGRAGYMLGLAVGMRLGPDAFKGGAR